jgi:hypothetical protein
MHTHEPFLAKGAEHVGAKRQFLLLLRHDKQQQLCVCA